MQNFAHPCTSPLSGRARWCMEKRWRRVDGMVSAGSPALVKPRALARVVLSRGGAGRASIRMLRYLKLIHLGRVKDKRPFEVLIQKPSFFIPIVNTLRTVQHQSIQINLITRLVTFLSTMADSGFAHNHTQTWTTTYAKCKANPKHEIPGSAGPTECTQGATCKKKAVEVLQPSLNRRFNCPRCQYD